MKPFNLEKALAGEKLVTRDGREVTQLTRFVCTNTYQVCAVVGGDLHSFTLNGSHSDIRESPIDLFMAEPERWVNVYWNEGKGGLFGSIYASEAEAKEKVDVSDYTIYQTTIKLK